VMEHLGARRSLSGCSAAPSPSRKRSTSRPDRDALDAAHKHGIIHAICKPGNVMLTTGGTGRSGTVSAKLLDFGWRNSAAHGEPGAGDRGLRADADAARDGARHIVGTLQYMAPEQLAGKASMRARTCGRSGRWCTNGDRKRRSSRQRP